MKTFKNVKLGEKINEGKTKIIYNIHNIEFHDPKHSETSNKKYVMVSSKDDITANNALKHDVMVGKSYIASETTCCIFELLNYFGIPTHFVGRLEDSKNSFIAHKCKMYPIEWVIRRIATGSYLKRHKLVREGTRFIPPKLETFFKDDAQGDPQISYEEIVCSTELISFDPQEKVNNPALLRKHIYDKCAHLSVTIFEILERIWHTIFDVTLVDMKIEFGVTEDGQVVLADVIDNDSWRLWPQGCKDKQVDKQVYRDFKGDKTSEENLQMVKAKYQWVLDCLEKMPAQLNNMYTVSTILILLASPTDLGHGQAIETKIRNYLHSNMDNGVFPPLVNIVKRIVSAHKSTEVALSILAEYQTVGQLVIIACAGLSNGLGPVIAGNTPFPVINCPPNGHITHELQVDVWSSLRMPSGIACSTVTTPDGAALSALASLSNCHPFIWAHGRARQTTLTLKNCEIDYDLNKNVA